MTKFKEREEAIDRLDSVMVRMAFDDFDAMIVADAMQSQGWVDVFSIAVTEASNNSFNEIGPSSKYRFHVYCKYASQRTCPDDIDKAIHDARKKWSEK